MTELRGMPRGIVARTYWAEFGSVYDGDTLHMDVCLFADTVFKQDLWRRGFRYRLARINAPEMSTPAGKAAADALKQFCATFENRSHWELVTAKMDPYGRYIADIFTPPVDNVRVSLSDWMLAEGLALPVTYKLSDHDYLEEVQGR